MNYIIFDLEWNQAENNINNISVPGIPFEIIEIGAVKLSTEREYLDSFHQIIKPVIYPHVHYMTRNITNLTAEELGRGTSFPEAANAFMNWCGKEYIFCTWGMTDLTELQRNMQYYHISLPSFPVFYYDLQKIYSLLFEDGKTRRSLEYVIDFFNIKQAHPFHRAIYDAEYTADIFMHLDPNFAAAHYSIDAYQLPHTKHDEIYAYYENYSKYISRGFEDKLRVMADKNVTATVCYKCQRKLRKKIRWFSGNSKVHYCLCICPEHGFLKGKIRIKKHDNGLYFAIRTLKLTDDEGAQKIYDRQTEIRKKRRLKRAEKR